LLKTSPLKEFFPLEFKIDLNGKKNQWEAIVQIPFIDESKLISAANSQEFKLSPEEKERNSSLSFLFILSLFSFPKKKKKKKKKKKN